MREGGVEFINAFYKHVVNEIRHLKIFKYCFRRKK